MFAGVLHGARPRRERSENDEDYRRVYSFLRPLVARWRPELEVALARRTALDREQVVDRVPEDAPAQTGAQVANIEDLQLVAQFGRVFDGEPTSDWTQRLSDLWWRTYERPVQRVCLLLWFLGQELNEPGNSKQAPPSLGTLFDQARSFTEGRMHAKFPFRPDLPRLRTSIHARQLRFHPSATGEPGVCDVSFLDRDGNLLDMLSFEELADRVSQDLLFCVNTDDALEDALLSDDDERGTMDSVWERVQALLVQR